MHLFLRTARGQPARARPPGVWPAGDAPGGRAEDQARSEPERVWLP